MPAVLIFAAAAGGPLKLPLAAGFASLGEASYAIYLVHVPFAHAWMKVFASWLGEPGGSLGFIALGVPLLLLLSLIYHRMIERPMTSALNRALGGEGRRKGDFTRTLAP
jgi:peptidoglycan/LPS O-acetylase OafA/YrhL